MLSQGGIGIGADMQQPQRGSLAGGNNGSTTPGSTLRATSFKRCVGVHALSHERSRSLWNAGFLHLACAPCSEIHVVYCISCDSKRQVAAVDDRSIHGNSVFVQYLVAVSICERVRVAGPCSLNNNCLTRRQQVFTMTAMMFRISTGRFLHI